MSCAAERAGQFYASYGFTAPLSQRMSLAITVSHTARILAKK